MFEVIRIKNDNKTVIENLGTMEEDDFIEFSKKYIGKDTSQWGTIFNDEKEILSDIEFIKGTGNEMWFETEDTNLIINYVEKGELKYNATLITLEEFDSRIAREEEKVIKLEDKILAYKEEIKKLEEEKNNYIIKERQALDKLNVARKTIINEYQDKLINCINSEKGTLSKKRICEIIKQKI